MKLKKYLRLYLRSPLNFFLVSVNVGLAILAWLLLPGLWRLIVPAGLVAEYFLTTAVFVTSRQGAHQVAARQAEEWRKDAAARITRDSALRAQLARLRLPDRELGKAVEYFLLISGTYLEKCREQGTYLPAGSEKIAQVLQLCQVHLEELDQSATERRYALPDTDGFEDYGQRIPELIREAAAELKELTTGELDGLSRSGQVEIIEELKS